MLKPKLLAQAVALAILLPGVAYAELEISGEAKIEYDMFTSDGMVTGATEEHSSGDALKSEYGIKLFLNADVGEESAFHAELLLADDGEAASSRLEGGEEYSQYEILRELYLDTSAGGWDFRLGKQQVVWGTADGIKLLDIINPTDYRELNQNVSEDSRIPVWMINAEKYFDSGDSVQVIVSEAKSNFIAGLTDEGNDAGAPFIFKGVDTITGNRNGFLNIGKDMGQTAGIFQSLLSLGGLTGLVGGPMSYQTVGSFTSIGTDRAPFVPDDGVDPANGVHQLTFNDVGAQLNASLTGTDLALFNKVFFGVLTAQGYQNGDQVLAGAANDGEGLFSAFNNYLGGTLVPAAFGVTTYTADGSSDAQTVEAVDYLLKAMGVTSAGGSANPGTTDLDLTDDATRAGFAAAFAGMTPEQQQAAFNTPQVQGLAQVFGTGTTNQFDTEVLNTDNPTTTFDYMGNTTFATFNDFIGMNTVYRQDHPDGEGNFGLRYKGSTESGINYSVNYLYAYDPNPIVNIHWEDGATGKELAVVRTATTLGLDGSVVDPGVTGETTTAATGTANTYDVMTVTLDGKTANVPANLVFQEELNQVNNLGGSFDMALDGTSIPTVIRGEFLYSAGAMAPVIDLDALSIGDLVSALKMEETDYFKYVLGVDLTVATNMLVSTQLIQMYNLDFVDDGNRYTGDFSTMSLTNNMNKGDEVETFISFFLSKPFGSDVQHRWNNILIYENEGGYWNRFDVEYSFNDDMVGTVELNSYWGEENTTFGQFKDSSNLQLGFKYIF